MLPEKETLLVELRRIQQESGDQAENLVEQYLKMHLFSLSPKERQSLLSALIEELQPVEEQVLTGGAATDKSFLRFCSMLLGEKVDPSLLNSDEMQERLVEALDTIFTSLNQLVQSINMTLLEGRQAEETIRQIIGSHLEDRDGSKSLEDYIAEIRKAFFTSHEAFKKSAGTLVARILRDLEPPPLEESGRFSLKLGATKKAESYEHFLKVFQSCKKWYDSGRYMDDYLREFEKQCHNLTLRAHLKKT